MISSLGPSAIAGCAAARAGIRRAVEIDSFAVGEDAEFDAGALIGHAAVPSGFVGPGKARSLISGAIRDLRSRFDVTTCNPTRTCVHLALSDSFFVRHWAAKEAASGAGTDGTREVDPRLAAALSSWTTSQLRLRLPAENTTCSTSGRVGFVTGIGGAVEAIRAGRIDRAIVGAVDSLLEPWQLSACANLGVLKSDSNPCGFEPGEAGAFLVLERADQGGSPSLSIESWATTASFGDRFTVEGPIVQAVQKSILEALALAGSDEAVRSVVGDLNGEPFRSQTWGHVLVSGPSTASLGTADLWLPAAHFGETGAATGAVAICLLLRGCQRGYARSGRSLVWLLGNEGSAGSIVLRVANENASVR